MTQDKMRAEFEAWAKEQGLAIYRCKFFTDEYESTHTQAAWDGWQAAQKREPLSDDGIKKHMGVERGSPAFLVIEAVIRATEAAHNITKVKP